VLRDCGRKQAGVSGIGVQWGRRIDKSEFTCAGMESPVMTQNDFEILGKELGNTCV
jgi:hypothetical protein